MQKLLSCFMVSVLGIGLWGISPAWAEEPVKNGETHPMMMKNGMGMQKGMEKPDCMADCMAEKKMGGDDHLSDGHKNGQVNQPAEKSKISEDRSAVETKPELREQKQPPAKRDDLIFLIRKQVVPFNKKGKSNLKRQFVRRLAMKKNILSVFPVVRGRGDF